MGTKIEYPPKRSTCHSEIKTGRFLLAMYFSFMVLIIGSLIYAILHAGDSSKLLALATVALCAISIAFVELRGIWRTIGFYQAHLIRGAVDD